MTSAKAVVAEFWASMATNDFVATSLLLDEGYRCYWPQSSEIIEGRDNFVKVNEQYPAKGLWRFSIQRLVAEDGLVVSEVDITDGSLIAKAVTFHTIANGLIREQVEYWPEPYDPPSWRSRWVTVGGRSQGPLQEMP